MSLLLPGKVYEYITTAAGLMLLYNWSLILLSSGKLLKSGAFDKVKRWLGLLLIAIAVTGTLFHTLSRPGFYISLLLVSLIVISDVIVQRFRKKKSATKTSNSQKGEDEEHEQSATETSSFHITGIRLSKKRKIK